jgi:hypothetical protein
VSTTSSKVEARVHDVQVPTHKSELIRAVHAISIDIRKCDEGRPSCLNCKKHGVLCDFETSGWASTSITMPPVMIPPLQKRASPEVAP